MQPLVSDLDVGGMSLLLLLLQVLQLTAPGLGEDVEREGAIRKIAVFENRIVTRSAEGGETSPGTHRCGPGFIFFQNFFSHIFFILF